MKAAHPGEIIEVWHSDQTRLGLHGTVARMWAERGSRPTAPLQMDFEWTFLWGAANAQSGERFGLVLPEVSTEMASLFFEAFSQHLGEGRHAVVVVDNAPWHRAKALRLASNLTLLFLPPYSPELNPIERLWLWIKEHSLSNSVFETLEALVDRLCGAWRGLTPERIQTVCRATWAEQCN